MLGELSTRPRKEFTAGIGYHEYDKIANRTSGALAREWGLKESEICSAMKIQVDKFLRMLDNITERKKRLSQRMINNPNSLNFNESSIDDKYFAEFSSPVFEDYYNRKRKFIEAYDFATKLSITSKIEDDTITLAYPKKEFFASIYGEYCERASINNPTNVDKKVVYEIFQGTELLDQLLADKRLNSVFETVAPEKAATLQNIFYEKSSKPKKNSQSVAIQKKSLKKKKENKTDTKKTLKKNRGSKKKLGQSKNKNLKNYFDFYFFNYKRFYNSSKISKIPRHLKDTLNLGIKYSLKGKQDLSLILNDIDDIQAQIIRALSRKKLLEIDINRLENLNNNVKFTEMMIKLLKSYCTDYFKNSKEVLDNIREDTKSFLIQNNLVVKMADKNLGPVIMDKEWYTSMVEEHLNNPSYYQIVTGYMKEKLNLSFELEEECRFIFSAGYSEEIIQHYIKYNYSKRIIFLLNAERPHLDPK